MTTEPYRHYLLRRDIRLTPCYYVPKEIRPRSEEDAINSPYYCDDYTLEQMVIAYMRAFAFMEKLILEKYGTCGKYSMLISNVFSLARTTKVSEVDPTDPDYIGVLACRDDINEWYNEKIDNDDMEARRIRSVVRGVLKCMYDATKCYHEERDNRIGHNVINTETYDVILIYSLLNTDVRNEKYEFFYQFRDEYLKALKNQQL